DRRLPRRQEGPVVFPPGALLDPRLEGRDLPRRERFRLPPGGHPFVVVDGGGPLPGEGALRVPRREPGPGPRAREGLGPQVEAELPLPRRLIGAVALEAMLRQDRADVPQIADGAILGTGGASGPIIAEGAARRPPAGSGRQDGEQHRARAREPPASDK